MTTTKDTFKESITDLVERAYNMGLDHQRERFEMVLKRMFREDRAEEIIQMVDEMAAQVKGLK